MKSNRTTKKPRADSKLKNLPEAEQVCLREYTKHHSLDQTVEWLREKGVTTSPAALSMYLKWWREQDQLRQDDQRVLRLVEKLRKEEPDLGEAKLRRIAQIALGLLAIEHHDAAAFFKLQKRG